MLNAGRALSNVELHRIMETLNCYKVISNKATFTYYFFRGK